MCENVILLKMIWLISLPNQLSKENQASGSLYITHFLLNLKVRFQSQELCEESKAQSKFIVLLV